MARRFAVLVGVILILGGISVVNKKVKAQGGCSLQTLSGPYTYAFRSSYHLGEGHEYRYSSIDRFVADENGNLAGTETNSDGTNVTRGRQYTGTYTVNTNDCTGSVVLGTNLYPLVDMDFVINNRKNINFIG